MSFAPAALRISPALVGSDNRQRQHLFNQFCRTSQRPFGSTAIGLVVKVQGLVKHKDRASRRRVHRGQHLGGHVGSVIVHKMQDRITPRRW